MSRRAYASCTVVPLYCFLILATAESVESGWVLWTQDVATEPGLVAKDKRVWARVATFDSKRACFTDASARAEGLAYGASEHREMEILRLGLGEDHLAVKSRFTGG